jgi:hypothetical protein
MRRITAAASLAVGCLTALALASPASAQSPWWHLTSGSRPTNLQPGLAKNEVQQVAVSATGGEFVLIENKEFKFAFFKWNATHEEVQEGLEGIYGKGNVAVAGGPGDEEGTKPYVITFTGELAGAPVEPMNAALSESFLNCEGATGSGCTKQATLIETVQGRPDGQIVVTAANLGDASAAGETTPVEITDKLPSGLKAAAIEGIVEANGHLGPVKCALEPGTPGEPPTPTCTFEGPVPPGDAVEVRIGVVDEHASSGEVNEASVSGGQAPSASVRRPITVSGQPTPFGVDDYELVPEEEGGAPYTQAGSHPFQLTTTLTLNQTGGHETRGADAEPAALAKDLHFQWPAGLIGNPTPIDRCALGQFVTQPNFKEERNGCPPQTAVGIAAVTVNNPGGGAELLRIVVPLFNLEPAVGEPARFGFYIPASQTPVIIDTSVRTGGDYGITVSVDNITQTTAFLSSEVTVWGVPADAQHDNQRGWGCLGAARNLGNLPPCTPIAVERPPPFLSLPTSCTGTPLQTSVQSDSWANPNQQQSFAGRPMPTMDGCNRLPFSASISVAPDGQAASTPSGLTTDVHVPQDESLNAGGLAAGNVKDITVALPEGLQLNPAAADGLQSCSEAQIGFTGENPQTGTDEFTATEPSCPDASKIGNVTIRTPLLPNPLKGFVYLAAPQNFSTPPQENPFASLVAMYVVARDPVSGVLVKLPGSVSLSETGQITATFKNTPDVAFEDAELEFYGGDRAPLATPSHCGTYTTSATFLPWSGGEAVASGADFAITAGPNGTPCPGVLPFNPSLAAGSPNINAGAFSPLTTTISRQDGNQDIQSVQLHMPPGMSGILAGVPLCGEAQANAGTCGPASLIGETIVSVGLGGDPFTVTGGKVYLTERYQGAPFGLSIVNPADAGPFHLGKVIVRARIEVDPHTAALTITTGAIPHILDGIPLQIKHVNVLVNRPGFTFNPTNCNPQSITGTIGSVEGASSPVSVPFQVTNCASLKFTPKFSVSTAGKTSKAGGASLTAKVIEPSGAMGTQANITKVKVELPKQLPSRLTTLQKACTSAQFEANPAGCPPASFIGHAVVHTPLLPVPLQGPAIFVSHGGEAFPSLVIVLQGYGVTVDLVGTTFISRAGITSTTFKTVPDVPFNSFELTLPQGKFSALAANLPANAKSSFCSQKLVMPAEFIAQNGAVLRQSTAVSVTGCAKRKALTRKQKLAKALKACKKKAKGKRPACVRQAHRKYGPIKKKK